MKWGSIHSLANHTSVMVGGGIALMLMGAITASHAAIRTWDGSQNGNWSAPANWAENSVPTDGDDLIFPPGALRKTNTNDLTGLQVDFLQFTGDSYVLRGQTLSIISVDGIHSDQASGTNTVELDLNLPVAQSLRCGQATTALSIVGNIVKSGTLTLAGLGNFFISGAISGTGNLSVNMGGTCVLSGAEDNTYSGTTFVDRGTLVLDKFNQRLAIPNGIVIGNGGGPDIVRLEGDFQIRGDANATLRGAGRFDLNGHSQSISNLTFLSGGIIQSPDGQLTVRGRISANASSIQAQIQSKLELPNTGTEIIVNDGSVSPDLRVAGGLTGRGGFTKLGEGQLLLESANNYQAHSVIAEGLVTISHDMALGSVSGETIIQDGASLEMSGDVHVAAEAITLAGAGNQTHARGALFSGGATNSWMGRITLADFCSIETDSGLNLGGAMVGPGGFAKLGVNTLTLSGSEQNTFEHLVHVQEGTLVLAKSIARGSIPNDLIIGDGIGGNQADVVITMGPPQININSGIEVELSGLFEINSEENPGSLAGSGKVNILTTISVGLNGRSTEFSGVIRGPGNFHKRGFGTLILSGDNSYTGMTQVSDGVLVVNGIQPQTDISVIDSDATLAGSGVVGNVDVSSGVLSPGHPLRSARPGVLPMGTLRMDTAGQYRAELNGTVSGSDYDQLNVLGTVDLEAPELLLVPSFISPAGIGSRFIILRNDASDAIMGEFDHQIEGNVFTSGDYRFRINYGSGSGNDIVLTLLDVPVTQAGYSVLGGLGTGLLDVNECSLLSLSISNQTDEMIILDFGSLASVTPGVVVTKPFSSFASIPPFGVATNNIYYQVSTAPWLPRGTNVQLELTLNSFSHGNFIMPVALRTSPPNVSHVIFANNDTLNIPDIGNVSSKIDVQGWDGNLRGLEVTAWITHPIVEDLTLELVAPNGRVVKLSSRNGGPGANYGMGCTIEADKAVFADDALASIEQASAPIVGRFRPQEKLNDLLTLSSVTGEYFLRITDHNGGTFGALRCWTLTLVLGGGECELCPNVIIKGAVDRSGLVQNNILNTSLDPANCESLKTCGSVPSSNPLGYGSHQFINGAEDACITVRVTSSADLRVAAYRTPYDPTSLCERFVADAGDRTGFDPAKQLEFSFEARANSAFSVVVFEASPGHGGGYSLSVLGGDCQPSLAVSQASRDKLQISWSTAYPNAQLETTDSINRPIPAWETLPGVPIIRTGRYLMTNDVVSEKAFFRLRP